MNIIPNLISGLGAIAISFILLTGSAQNTAPNVEPTLGAATSTIVQTLKFYDELMPDGSACSDGQILKKTGANNWDCAADDGGAGGGISSLNGLTTSTQTFATTTGSGSFTVTSAGSAHTIKIPSNVGFFTNDSGYLTTSTALTTGNFATTSISQWNNDSGYISTSTGLTTGNFATTSISQWNNDAGFVTSTGAGAISTSTAITINQVPYWVTTAGGLAGTSTLSIAGTAVNASGTISQSGVAVALSNVTISGGGLITGGGDLSSNRTLTFVSSTLGLGTASVQNLSAFLQPSNNLSELTATSTARTNLGLTSTATLASTTWLIVANNGSDINSTSTFRTNLGLGDSATLASSTWLKPGNNLSELTVTSTARTNLGLAIGTNVQAYDADLTTYAGITPSANVQTLLGAADYAAFKTSLSLNNVENTALSTWAGSGNITTLGTITSGTWTGTTIAKANGGTGITSSPTVHGELLMASSTGWTIGRLIAGSNVTVVTSTPGQITIAATDTNSGGTVTTSTAVTARYFPFWGAASTLSGTSTIYSSGTGSTARIGIGTLSPSTSLHLIGDSTFSATSTFAANVNLSLSGSILNFNAGDVTITHSSNLLTIGGGGLTATAGTATFGTLAGALDAGGATSLEVPNGAGGTTVDAAGEVTVDTTPGTFNFYDGTAERALNPEECNTFTVQNLTAARQGDSLYPFLATSTITKIFVSNKVTTESSTINFYASSSINSATATSTSRKVFTTDTKFSATSTALSCYAAATTTSCTGGVFGTNASTTINAGTSLGFYVNSASTSYANITYCFRQNP